MMARRQSSFRVYVDILEEAKEKEFDNSRSSGISSIGESEEGDHDTFVRVSWPANMEKDAQISSETKETDKAPLKGGATPTGTDCQNKEHVLARKDSASSESNVKLCGYLFKRRLGTRLNQYKKRWFVYSENSCKLVYYKYSNDINHLGEIELSRAAFTFDVENEKRSNVFRISSNGYVYLLQAPDRTTMMYWLQQLQLKRKQYWEQNSSTSDLLGTKPNQHPQKGLLKSSKSFPEETSGTLPVSRESSPSLLASIQVPTDTVGLGSTDAQPSNRWQNINDFSFVNIKTEMKNYAWRRKQAGKGNSGDVAEQSEVARRDVEPVARSNASILRRNRSFQEANNRNGRDRPRFAKSTMGLSFREHTFSTNRCSRCKLLLETLQFEREQSEALEEELEATKTVVGTLQNHIVGFMNNIGKGVEECVCETSEADNLEQSDRPNANHDDTLHSNHDDRCGHDDKPLIDVGESSPSNHDDRCGHDDKPLIDVSDSSPGNHDDRCGHDDKPLIDVGESSPSNRDDHFGHDDTPLIVVGNSSPGNHDDRCVHDDKPLIDVGNSSPSNHDDRCGHKPLIDLSDPSPSNHDNQQWDAEGNHAAQKQIDSLEAKMNDLEEKILMYQDIIRAKNAIIISQTDKVTELECMMSSNSTRKFSEPASFGSTCSNVLPPGERSKMQELKDTCEAFQVQNRFLSQEILDLNRLREQDELRERSHKVNYAKLEAEYYCTKSKYLVCLNELKKPKLDGDTSVSLVNQETISELLEDAMDSESKPVPDRPAIQEHEIYDKYGFRFIPPEAAEDVESRADSLQQKSDQLSAKANALDKEISVHVKWENFMIDLGDRSLERTQELKQLVRAGIPIEHREKIWNFCIHCHLGSDREQYGQNHYQNLLKKAAMSNSLNPAVTQVELDLLRTLPNNCHYESSSSEGIPKLRNVLLAFSLHNQDIGYCQGLNRLAAIALLFLEEEDAFWCLVVLVEYLLPHGYYSKGLVAAHIDQRVLKDLLMEKVPKLMALLQYHQIDLAMFTFNWFLTLFVDNAPVETYLKIWDSFLFEGSKVMFRFGVAFIKYCEEDLLQLKDSLSLHNYLRSLGEQITDVNKVSDIAFTTINPFPMKYITGRRHFHMQGVKMDIEEIRKKRVSLKENNNNTSQNGIIRETPSGGASARPPPDWRAAQYRSLNSDEDLDDG